jgi:hypothetical protein
MLIDYKAIFNFKLFVLFDFARIPLVFLGAVFLVEPATPAANLPSAEIAPLTSTSP